MKLWFVAHTHAQCETKAAFHLRRQGFSVYLPQYLKQRRHARRRDVVSAPLFPRYLFVAFDPDQDRWRSVHSTVGISHVISNRDYPVSVPDEVIDDIRAREDANGKVIINKLHPFTAGEKVRVLIGALADQIGIFDAETDEDRVRILFHLLGRTVGVEVPANAIGATA